jgi:hypothetical protein
MSGGLTGILGSLAGRVFSIFERREARQDRALANEESARMRGHELLLLRESRLTNAAETENEIAIARTQGSWAGLEASHTADAAATNVPGWANAVRAMVRPVLTPLLWVIAMLAFAWMLKRAEAGLIPAEDAALMTTYVINSAIYAATAATLWWFGDRARRSPRAGT